MVVAGGSPSGFAKGATKGPVFLISFRNPSASGNLTARVFVPRCKYERVSSSQSKTMLTDPGQNNLRDFFCSRERVMEKFSSSFASEIKIISGLLESRFLILYIRSTTRGSLALPTTP